MMRAMCRFAALLVLALVGCATTSEADRFPVASETVRWTLQSVRTELQDVAAEARSAESLNHEARQLLDLEHGQILAALERAERQLDAAERDLDVRRLEAVGRDAIQIGSQVDSLRRTVLIAEAAAKGSGQ